MKKTAVAFFTAYNGEKLEDDINRFFTNHDFVMNNISYSSTYDIGKGKIAYSAIAVYQYTLVSKGTAVVTEQNSYFTLQEY